jgi:hypothetical protein
MLDFRLGSLPFSRFIDWQSLENGGQVTSLQFLLPTILQYLDIV